MKAPVSIAARPMLGIPGTREWGFVLRHHPRSVSLIFIVMFLGGSNLSPDRLEVMKLR
jgi:hypothetical protein